MVKLKRRNYKLVNNENKNVVVFDNLNYIINKIDLGSVQSNINFYAGSGQFGSSVTNRTFGTRDITIEGFIISNIDGEMVRLKQRLETTILSLYDFDLIVDDKYKLTCVSDNTVQYSASWFENNQMICKFAIDAICPNPFFQTLKPINAEITSWIKDLHFPITFKKGETFTVGHQNPRDFAIVENKGDIPSGMIVKFKAIHGKIVNPWIYNPNTKEHIYIETILQPGEEIQICTDYGNKTIFKTTTHENILASMNLNSTFIQIPIGESIFSYGFDEQSEGTLQCNIDYTPKFVVV